MSEIHAVKERMLCTKKTRNGLWDSAQPIAANHHECQAGMPH